MSQSPTSAIFSSWRRYSNGPKYWNVLNKLDYKIFLWWIFPAVLYMTKCQIRVKFGGKWRLKSITHLKLGVPAVKSCSFWQSGNYLFRDVRYLIKDIQIFLKNWKSLKKNGKKLTNSRFLKTRVKFSKINIKKKSLC